MGAIPKQSPPGAPLEQALPRSNLDTFSLGSLGIHGIPVSVSFTIGADTDFKNLNSVGDLKDFLIRPVSKPLFFPFRY